MSDPDSTTLTKVCTKCGDTKTHGEFPRRSGAKDGLRPQCKVCLSAYNAAYHADRSEEIAVQQAAYRAAHREERAESSRKYDAERREERVAYKAAYRDEHSEEIADYNAAHYSAHREERVAYAAAHYAEHRDEAAVYGAAYYAAHREEIAAYRADHREESAEYRRVHRAEHPEEYTAYSRNRRARKLGNGGTHTAADIRAQYARQKGRCYWQATDACRDRRGKLGAKYHVDHVMPVILGGSNGPENLVIACPTCNLRKGGRHPQEFAGRLL